MSTNGSLVLEEAGTETSTRAALMSFSDFTIDDVKQRLGLRLDETQDFFADVAPVSVSSLLREILKENTPIALANSTEKARSEMIINPVLMEVRRHVPRRTSLFSGTEWTVDAARGLRGICDFLLSASGEQLTIEAPLVAVVEAKNENFKTGIGQCLAEMVAAQLFNQQRNTEIATVYGVVTTGNVWKFLRLVGTNAFLDETEYHIHQVDRIVGIIASMFNVQVSPCATPRSA